MIETASATTGQTRDGLTSLARITGKPLEEIVGLAERDELRSLFVDGKLKTEYRGVPLRDTHGGVSARQRALIAHQNRGRLIDLATRRLAWN